MNNAENEYPEKQNVKAEAATVPDSSSTPFNQEVQNISKEALDNIIGNSAYQHLTTNQWSQQAVETIAVNLVKLNKPYKYIVTCVIMQTCAGAGLSVSSTCYWDKSTDLSFTVRWENKSVVTIVNVFAVAL
ncbi:hypothetical protein AB6A40_000530 [Gnathostoma spinigerum]|uniref:Dynein light chain Tctex-type 1 n=1 Tax=Gnathostoma spinigerum TaxID=75299 RepID=A0ABD6E3I0_9BILA